MERRQTSPARGRQRAGHGCSSLHPADPSHMPATACPPAACPQPLGHRQDVYLMIAGSFGVSAAMEQSGGAAAIANLVITIGNSAGGGNFTIAAICERWH